MYVVEFDDSVPVDEIYGRSIVVKTTDGPEGSEPEPLFWTTDKLVGELIEGLRNLTA